MNNKSHPCLNPQLDDSKIVVFNKNLDQGNTMLIIPTLQIHTLITSLEVFTKIT